MTSLSIIVASSGRPTLTRTLESIQSQTHDGDEILVSINTDCPWGHKARNQLMRVARGDYLMFMDDDDAYLPGALDLVRSAPSHYNDERLMHIYRMRHANGTEPWDAPVVRLGNVSTQMVAVPNIAAAFAGCEFGDRYEGDFDFITACAQRLAVAWHEEPIALYRPVEPDEDDRISDELYDRLDAHP